MKELRQVILSSIINAVIALSIFSAHAVIACTLLCFGRRCCEKLISMIFLQHSKLFAFVHRITYGTKVIIDTPPSLPSPHLILCNHKGTSDFFLAHLIFRERKLRFIAKQELLKAIPLMGIPAYSIGMRLLGYCFIDRSHSLSSLKAVQKFIQRHTAQNHDILLYPEGTRHKAAQTKEFFSSAIKLILRAQHMPVVLVALGNGHTIVSFLRRKYATTLRAKVLGVFHVQDSRDIENDVRKFRSAIDAQLDKWEHE
ncbi:uncharacterized protein LOC132562982 [Ylistrum balloti]|uniref:uncharacterized protein LOC132562982 n=1 Tax=Ylistrum balloti TaxID=509963 RepID=UPI002905D2E1|nr:uncharacterized protein LOC132562982 [Ylistrum balloti]